MTTRVSVFPLANRGSSRVIDHDGSGLIAYGVRSFIYVFDFRTSPPILVDSMILPNSHPSRVLSVSFCKSNKQLLASVGEEGTVKIWDLETASCVCSQDVKEICCVVEWLYDSVNTIVFPDTHGSVSKWNFKAGTVVRMKTGSNSMVCIMSSNKSSPELLAVGHTIGTVSVLNVNSQALVCILKTHLMEITSLSWSPVSPLMLLSVSMDHSARLWKLGEEKPFRTYYFPTSRYKNDDKKKSKFCGLFHPDNPDVIICSNVRGEVGAVTFKEDEVPKFKPYNVKDSDPCYNNKTLHAMVPYCTETGNSHLFLGLDYTKISLWDATKEKLLSTYSFSSGSINFLSVSTNNPNLMAICAGDGFIRIWNVASETKKVEVSLIYTDFRDKIMCAAWHPTEENILACGSGEGRVRIVDIYKKKLLCTYETHHSKTVYSLQWAPCVKLEDSQDKFFLYSVGGGCIYVYELNKPKEKPAEFSTLITLPPDLETSLKGCTELSWKSDYTCLAIGNTRGFVELFDSKLNFLARLTLQMKNIESLKWHPMYTFASPNGSNYSSWLAAAGFDDSIHIFDATDVIKGQSETILCKSTRTLVGHKKRVSSVCWSPHNDGHLVSASRDGTAQVWNVITGTSIAIYPCHRDLVYAVQWSLFDPDVIYSGGCDNCLRIWKISEQSKTFSAEKFKVVKHKAYKPREKESDVKRVKFSDVNSSQKDSSEVKTSINEISEESKNVAEDVRVNDGTKKDNKENQRTKYDSFISKKQAKALFPDIVAKFHSKEECVDDIIQLTDLICHQPENDCENALHAKVTPQELLKFGLFADQFTALKMLETRANVQNVDGNIEKTAFLQVMACNVEPLLTQAAEKKQLSDFLLAFAPRVSYKFWHEMCEKYAMQLVEEQNFLKASMYFLSCGKLQDAIKLLMEKSKFLEALAMAKAQLPESDPLLHAAYYKAAYQFAINQMVVSEASCYLSTKEPLQAAKILFCTKSSKHIYASTYICKKFNLIEEANTYGYFCMEKCLSQNDWPTFHKVVELVDSLKIYEVLVRVHEVLSMHIKELKKDDDSKLFGMTGSKLLIWKGYTFKDSNLSFLSHIYEVIRNEGILPEDKTYLEEIHNALDAMILKRKKYEIPAEAHIGVAIYLTQVIITSLLGDFHLATKYFMKIFTTAHNIAILPKIIHQLFLPLDLYWCYSKDNIICEAKIKDIEIFPFATHFQNIYGSVCDKFESIGQSDPNNVTIFPCVSADLTVVIQQVLSILSEMTKEDSLMLYFCAFYLNELRRQAKKGWKFRCYSSIANSKLPQSTANGNEIEKNDAESVQQSPSSVNCLPEQITEYQNGTEEKPDESVSLDVTACKSADTHEDESGINSVKSMEKTVSSSSCVLKQTEKFDEDIRETTLLNLTDCKAGGDEITTSENIDEAKSRALDMIDKILSGEKLPVIESCGDSVEQSKAKPIEECQNGPEEKPDESVSLDVTACKSEDTHENESAINGVNSAEQTVSSSSCVLKQTEKFDGDIRETTVSNLTDCKAGGDEITTSENIDEAKSRALDLIDKILSGEKLPVIESSGNGIKQSKPKPIEECQNGAEEKPSETILLNVTDRKTDVCGTSTLENEIESFASNNSNTVNPEANVPTLENDASSIEQSCDTTLVCGDNEDEHLQCWTDISLYYVVVKFLISVICKDNYALKFYLEKCLHQLDSTIANLARQKSAKSLVKLSKSNKVSKEISNQKSNGLESNSSSHEETDVVVNVIQHSADSDTSKFEVITDAVGEQKCDTNIVNGSSFQEDKASTTVENDSTLKIEVVTDSAEEIKSDIDIENDSVQQENQVGAFEVVTDSAEEIKSNIDIENDSVQQENQVGANHEIEVNSNHEISDDGEKSPNINAVVRNDGNMKLENEVNSISEVSETSCAAIIDAAVEENEHEKLSEQIKLLSSEEFSYPNPFEAVLAVYGICCDIYNKNPCKLIKVKFHELAHEVNKWNAKFCTKDETLTCLICHEKFSA